MVCKSGTVGMPISCVKACRFSSERLYPATILIACELDNDRLNTFAQRPNPTIPTLTIATPLNLINEL